MNTNLFEKFTCKLSYYQILYVFLVICMIVLIILGLIKFENINSITYHDVVLNDNVLELNNLSFEEVNLLLECKKTIIGDKKINLEKSSIINNKNMYSLKIDVSNIKFDKNDLKLKCILKKEKLYKFIFRIVKGES